MSFACQFNTVVGQLYYVWDKDKQLLYLGNDEQRFFQFKQRLEGKVTEKRFNLLEEEIRSYLSGNLKQFSVDTRLVYGTRFFIQVLNTLKEIGYGQVISYRQLAQRSGYPQAWRAVGTVMGKNPIMIVIPCHRVVKSDGSRGNYTAGVPIKHYLLDLEAGAID